MREFVITDASMPRLDSALLAQYPQLSPGRLHKYLRENKIKVDGKKLPLSARLPRGSTVRVFCRICFWISRTARYFFPQGRSCAPFMKTATSWLPTSPPDFL